MGMRNTTGKAGTEMQSTVCKAGTTKQTAETDFFLNCFGAF